MFLKGKVAECNKEHYCTLEHITEIKQWHIDSNPKWGKLKKQYEHIEEVGSFDWTAYAITSFSNAILTQDRIFFVLGRDSFWKQARKDSNWQKFDGYSNKKWNIFLDYLTGKEGGHEYIRLYKDGDNNTKIYQLVDETLLEMLKVDPEKQLQECLEYAKNNDEKVKEKNSNKNNKLDNNYDRDGLRDGLRDEVTSNKVVSNKVVSNCSDSMKEESHDQELTMAILFAEQFNIRIGENKGLLPGKDMIPSLAKYAAENLAKENCTTFDFKRWLLNLAGGRFGTKKGKTTGKSQKEYAEEYISIFGQCIEEYFYMVSDKKIEIKKPQTIKQNKTDKKDVNKDDKETLNAIYSTVGIERVNWLEKNIEKEQDPKEKFMMEWELDRIRSIVYGN